MGKLFYFLCFLVYILITGAYIHIANHHRSWSYYALAGSYGAIGILYAIYYLSYKSPSPRKTDDDDDESSDESIATK